MHLDIFYCTYSIPAEYDHHHFLPGVITRKPSEKERRWRSTEVNTRLPLANCFWFSIFNLFNHSFVLCCTVNLEHPGISRCPDWTVLIGADHFCVKLLDFFSSSTCVFGLCRRPCNFRTNIRWCSILTALFWTCLPLDLKHAYHSGICCSILNSSTYVFKCATRPSNIKTGIP